MSARLGAGEGAGGTPHIEAARLMALGLGETATPIELAHLGGCATCAAVPAADARLWQRFRQIDQPVPPPHLGASALQRFRAVRATRARSQTRNVVIAALIVVMAEAAAGVLVWRLAPGALLALVQSLSHVSSVVSVGVTLGRVLAAALPAIVLAAVVALASVVLVLKRLTVVRVK